MNRTFPYDPSKRELYSSACRYDYIRFYHLRSYDRINAPFSQYSRSAFRPFVDSLFPLASFISAMEQTSGVKFHEAQVALARQWIGPELGQDAPHEINIKAPEPTKEGVVVSDKTDVKTEKVLIPDSYDAAREIIEKFEKGADNIRGDEEVSDTVAQHMLMDRTGLEQEKWLGTDEEELNA
jgi:phospholipase D1/2